MEKPFRSVSPTPHWYGGTSKWTAGGGACFTGEVFAKREVCRSDTSADATKLFMGLTTWKHASGGKILATGFYALQGPCARSAVSRHRLPGDFADSAGDDRSEVCFAFFAEEIAVVGGDRLEVGDVIHAECFVAG